MEPREIEHPERSKSLASLAGFLSGVQADPLQLEKVRSFFGYLRATSPSIQTRLAWYEILFELAPQAYLVTDHLGLIQNANATAMEMFGIDLDSMVGLPLGMLLPENEIVFNLFPEEEASPAARISTFELELALPNKPRFCLRGRVTQAYDSHSGKIFFLWLLDAKRTAEQEPALQFEELRILPKPAPAQMVPLNVARAAAAPAYAYANTAPLE
ncbi:MAG TPA: PAS domain-containing protein [Anaerolineae bacterium]|nr:PAS domain-containing protein [Anaerolineae bacterium]